MKWSPNLVLWYSFVNHDLACICVYELWPAWKKGKRRFILVLTRYFENIDQTSQSKQKSTCFKYIWCLGGQNGSDTWPYFLCILSSYPNHYEYFFIFMYLTHGFWLNSTVFCHFHDIFSGFWGGKRSRNKKLDALELFFFHVCLSGTYIESLAKVQLLTSKFDFWLSTALTRALFRAFWGILPYRSIFQGSSWDHMYDIRLAIFVYVQFYHVMGHT